MDLIDTDKNKIISVFEHRVKKSLVTNGLSHGSILVVAVSGGPASLALLYALNRIKKELGLNLYGAHLNHQLRGVHSTEDAEFTSDCFKKLGIPFSTEKVDTLKFQDKHKLSIEQAARELRYNFLSKVAKEQNATAITLGHTSDDQAETVLMHIIRGSGLNGLKGMEETSSRVINSNKVTLSRPLLSVSRAESVNYCCLLKLIPRLDASNLSPKLKRNQIRMQLLPLLNEYNPAVKEALIRLSHSAKTDLEYIRNVVDDIWPDIANHYQNHTEISKSQFSKLAPAIQYHVLRKAITTVKGNLEDVRQEHIYEMAHLMKGQAGKHSILPGRLRFSIGYDSGILTSFKSDPCPIPAITRIHDLKVPADNLIPGWSITTILNTQVDQPIDMHSQREAMLVYPVTHKATLDYDKLGGNLRIRSRGTGDRFHPLGMTQAKKLQDFMVDSKIPQSWRNHIPLVVSPKGIIWVVGWRIAEWAKVDNTTRTQLEIKIMSIK